MDYNCLKGKNLTMMDLTLFENGRGGFTMQGIITFSFHGNNYDG
jgi:hypothetical protein